MAESLSDRNMTFLAASRVNITLSRAFCAGQAGSWRIDSVNIKSDGASHHVHFDTPRDVAGLCSTRFWAFIAPYLPEDAGKKQVLSAKDAVFQLDRFYCKGVNATSYAMSQGVQRVLLTLKTVVGSLARVMDLAYDSPIGAESVKKLSLKALEDIVMPVLNLAAVEALDELETSQDHLRKFAQKIKRNTHEIEFYATLLSRYLSHDGNRVDDSAGYAALK